MSILTKILILSDKPCGPVCAVGRDTLEFREGDRRLQILAMILVKGPFKRRIVVSSINNWEKPHDKEELTDDMRRRILKEACEFLAKKRITFELVEVQEWMNTST